MIRAFLDINVALDLVVRRDPFYDDEKYLVDISRTGAIKLQVSSGGISNLIYNAYKYKN